MPWSVMKTRSVTVVVALALLSATTLPVPASGQCILANPSFEILGSGGEVLGGWNHFGAVGWDAEADHGARAARVSGPGWGDPGVSGFWQSQDCVPGEQWEATGRVRHSSTSPLDGSNHAMVNIEWRDGADELLGYDTFSVADPGTPADEYIDFQVLGSPAPAGTVETRILFAVYQAEGSASPDVYYDSVTFHSTSPPTIDDVQWNDFPGGTTVDFAGRSWRVKGPGTYGPGNNRFCNHSGCVWVDAQDALHLTLQKLGAFWYSTEVVLEEALGYGDYVLTTEGRLDLLDPQVVLGMFLWQYGPCWDYGYLWWNAFNEIDIEYSRWGNPARDLGQFVAQPFDYPGNISRFDKTFSEGELVSHAMRWLSDRVEYRVWLGGPDDEAPGNMVHSWIYTGPHIPRPEQPRMHLNLWKLDGTPATNQEVVFQDFTFVPDDVTTSIIDGPTDRVPTVAVSRLYPATPNPFNPSTTIRFELERGEFTRLDVYDIAGRHVRTLVREYQSDGRHDVVWNGRDNGGSLVASGVYLVRLRGSEFVETRRVSLIK